MAVAIHCVMNISFASVLQSVQVKPQSQAASISAYKPKTVSSTWSIKDEYVPSIPTTAKPHYSVKMQKVSSPISDITKGLNRMVSAETAPPPAQNANTPTPQAVTAEGLDNLTKAEYVPLPQQHVLAWDAAQQKNFELGHVVMERHSKHLDMSAWALGIETTGNSWHEALRFSNTEDGVRFLRSQLQANREKIDDKITGILKANNIVLGTKETLNLKVNQNGKITIGDGMDASKRERIEKLLNEDKTLANDLLFTYAERKWAVMGDGSGGSATQYILTDTILQREYGVSLSDFQLSNSRMNPNEPDWKPSHAMVPKDGGSDMVLHGDNALLDEIYNEEMSLYYSIEQALKNLDENEGDFEINFVYKNGVTIEKGATDQAALNKAAEMFTHSPFAGLGTKSSVTIDPFGMVLNARVTNLGNYKGTLADATSRLLSWFGIAEKADIPRNNSNTIPTQSRLQQYAFDAQRLFQFNTGVDTETAKSMNVTFGTSGAAWWEMNTTGTTKNTNKTVVEEKSASDLAEIDKNVSMPPIAETPRIFSTAPESVENLIRFFGLNTINGSDATLAGTLNLTLETAAEELTNLLNGLLLKAGLNSEKNEIIIAEDDKGNIIIEGDIDTEKKKLLAELINNDPELVERIKDHKAKMEIVRGLDQEGNLDISSEQFAAARKQLLNSFLQREGGFSLTDVGFRIDPASETRRLFQQDGDGNEITDSLLPTILSQMPGLETELFRFLDSPMPLPQVQSGEAVRSLLAINRCVMSEAI